MLFDQEVEDSTVREAIRSLGELIPTRMASRLLTVAMY
jgi:hypothetical protein